MAKKTVLSVIKTAISAYQLKYTGDDKVGTVPANTQAFIDAMANLNDKNDIKLTATVAAFLRYANSISNISNTAEALLYNDILKRLDANDDEDEIDFAPFIAAISEAGPNATSFIKNINTDQAVDPLTTPIKQLKTLYWKIKIFLDASDKNDTNLADANYIAVSDLYENIYAMVNSHPADQTNKLDKLIQDAAKIHSASSSYAAQIALLGRFESPRFYNSLLLANTLKALVVGSAENLDFYSNLKAIIEDAIDTIDLKDLEIYFVQINPVLVLESINYTLSQVSEINPALKDNLKFICKTFKLPEETLNKIFDKEPMTAERFEQEVNEFREKAQLTYQANALKKKSSAAGSSSSSSAVEVEDEIVNPNEEKVVKRSFVDTAAQGNAKFVEAALAGYRDYVTAKANRFFAAYRSETPSAKKQKFINALNPTNIGSSRINALSLDDITGQDLIDRQNQIAVALFEYQLSRYDDLNGDSLYPKIHETINAANGATEAPKYAFSSRYFVRKIDKNTQQPILTGNPLITELFAQILNELAPIKDMPLFIKVLESLEQRFLNVTLDVLFADPKTRHLFINKHFLPYLNKAGSQDFAQIRKKLLPVLFGKRKIHMDIFTEANKLFAVLDKNFKGVAPTSLTATAEESAFSKATTPMFDNRGLQTEEDIKLILMPRLMIILLSALDFTFDTQTKGAITNYAARTREALLSLNQKEFAKFKTYLQQNKSDFVAMIDENLKSMKARGYKATTDNATLTTDAIKIYHGGLYVLITDVLGIKASDLLTQSAKDMLVELKPLGEMYNDDQNKKKEALEAQAEANRKQEIERLQELKRQKELQEQKKDEENAREKEKEKEKLLLEKDISDKQMLSLDDDSDSATNSNDANNNGTGSGTAVGLSKNLFSPVSTASSSNTNVNKSSLTITYESPEVLKKKVISGTIDTAFKFLIGPSDSDKEFDASKAKVKGMVKDNADYFNRASLPSLKEEVRLALFNVASSLKTKKIALNQERLIKQLGELDNLFPGHELSDLINEPEVKNAFGLDSNNNNNNNNNNKQSSSGAGGFFSSIFGSSSSASSSSSSSSSKDGGHHGSSTDSNGIINGNGGTAKPQTKVVGKHGNINVTNGKGDNWDDVYGNTINNRSGGLSTTMAFASMTGGFSPSSASTATITHAQQLHQQRQQQQQSEFSEEVELQDLKEKKLDKNLVDDDKNDDKDDEQDNNNNRPSSRLSNSSSNN